MNKLKAFSTILGNSEFVVVDLGGRSGLIYPWSEVKSIVKSVVFEPEELANEITISNENRETQTVTIPNAVGGRKESRNFYVLRNRSYCSLLKPNESELEGTYYYDRNFYQVEKIQSISVDTREHYLNNLGIKSIDFLKIDSQGAEMMVFEKC